MELLTYNIQGEDTGRKITSESLVSGMEPNDHVIYLTVRRYRANQRQDVYRIKECSEMSDSTRKLFHRKDTGGARRGDINSNILRGGVHVFGPHPRSYSFKLNGESHQLTRRSTFAYKAQNNQIMILDQLSFEASKTKLSVSTVKAPNVDDQRTLYVVSQIEDTVALSTCNIPGASITHAQNLNTYHVLDCRKIVFTENALAQVNGMF